MGGLGLGLAFGDKLQGFACGIRGWGNLLDELVHSVHGRLDAGHRGYWLAEPPSGFELHGTHHMGTARPAVILLSWCAMGQLATWRQKPEHSGDDLGCLVVLRELTVEAVLVIDGPRSAWADPLALEIGVVVGCPHWHLDERCCGNLLE